MIYYSILDNAIEFILKKAYILSNESSWGWVSKVGIRAGNSAYRCTASDGTQK